ncbi:cold-shock protein [Pseudotabrizicola sp. L79]|uniref:cold-shock protein n=1 Tax=Pseudotabrizicola sp. L79 TaxID=3118402 RepID=UPI002F924C78
MTEDDTVLRVLDGRVKWFDATKGFGFIISDESETDILLHANVLRNYGQSTVADGAGIRVKVQATQRGVQAVEVLEVQAPVVVSVPLSDEQSEVDAATLAALPLEPARVKWFDKAKGFGFANVFGHPEDVFIHIEVLRVSGFADLQAGEAVSLKIIQGRRGRMAVQVMSWEAAARVGQQA